MYRRNVYAKLSIAIALVAIASTVTIWEARRVHVASASVGGLANTSHRPFSLPF